MERAFMIAANGGFQTLRSFGVEPIGTPEQQARKAVRAALPPHVLDRMVEALSRPWHEIGERFIAVHAGFDPYDDALENQHLFHMLWIRAPFLLSDHDFGRIVIHGHTPTGGLPEVRPNRINVDVGSYKTGALCAAVIGNDRLLGFLHTESRWIGADLYAPHPAVA
jgi:serine/threonine protein phosphatase 1